MIKELTKMLRNIIHNNFKKFYQKKILNSISMFEKFLIN